MLCTPGTPECPHSQQGADRVYSGEASAGIFSNLEDALSESKLQSPQGICPCPQYFVSETGLTLFPNMH